MAMVQLVEGAGSYCATQGCHNEALGKLGPLKTGACRVGHVPFCEKCMGGIAALIADRVDIVRPGRVTAPEDASEPEPEGEDAPEQPRFGQGPEPVEADVAREAELRKLSNPELRARVRHLAEDGGPEFEGSWTNDNCIAYILAHA